MDNLLTNIFKKQDEILNSLEQKNIIPINHSFHIELSYINLDDLYDDIIQDDDFFINFLDRLITKYEDNLRKYSIYEPEMTKYIKEYSGEFSNICELFDLLHFLPKGDIKNYYPYSIEKRNKIMKFFNDYKLDDFCIKYGNYEDIMDFFKYSEIDNFL